MSMLDVPTQESCASPETSWQTVRCVPVCCHGEESLSHSSTFQVFFFSKLFTKGRQTLHIVGLINGLTFRHPISMNHPWAIGKKKKDRPCFQIWLAFPCFFFRCWPGTLPLYGLALSFQVILKKPVIDHKLLHFLKKAWNFFTVLKNVSTNVHSSFSLLRSEDSWHRFQARFFHVKMLIVKSVRHFCYQRSLIQQLPECSGSDFWTI
jgi:hypothetical protein